MSIPTIANFDDLEASEEIGVIDSDTFNDVSQVKVISSTDFLIYDSITRDVENRHEISLLLRNSTI